MSLSGRARSRAARLAVFAVYACEDIGDALAEAYSTDFPSAVSDSSLMRSDLSVPRRRRHPGLREQPTAMRLIIYLTILAAVFLLVRSFAPTRVQWVLAR
jgi:hypothetical protein